MGGYFHYVLPWIEVRHTMSTAPSGWQTPKTNWQPSDPVGVSDMNRIEGNANAIETGSRTIDTAQAPTGNTGTLRQFLDWFANRIRAITGTANWYDAPPTTLAALANRKINTDGGLTGGGDLSADRTLSIADGGVTDAKLGNRTISDAAAPTGDTGTLTTLLGWLGNMIKQITGQANWRTAPPISLTGANAKFDGGTGHKHTGAAGDAPKLDPAQALTYVPVNRAGDTMSGPLSLPDGTAASPGLRFAADVDTGLQRPAADVLAFVAGGAERFRVDAGGPKVGTNAVLHLGNVAVMAGTISHGATLPVPDGFKREQCRYLVAPNYLVGNWYYPYALVQVDCSFDANGVVKVGAKDDHAVWHDGVANYICIAIKS